MFFTCRQFIGAPTARTYSQYWENEPDDPILRSARGHLFALVHFITPSGESTSVGHQFIDYFNQLYFASPEIPLPVHLASVFSEAVTSSPFQFDSIFLQVIIIQDQTLFALSSAGGQVIIYRQSRFASLISPGNTAPVSGPVKNHDRLFLSTPEFFKLTYPDQIRQNLALPQISELEENFLSVLYESPDPVTLAGVVIEIHAEESTDTSPAAVVSAPLPPPPATPTPVFPPPRRGSFFSRFRSKKPVFISTHDIASVTRRKRNYLVVSILIIITLTVSVLAGYQRNTLINTEKKYQELKTAFDIKFSEAKNTRSLNLAEAKSTAAESQKILEDMIALNFRPDEVASLKNEVDKFLNETGDEAKFTPEKYYDTSLITENPQFSAMTLSGDSLVLLDSATGRLDAVNIGNRSLKNILAKSDLIGASYLTADDDKIYLLKNSSILLVSRDSLVEKIKITESVPAFSGGEFKFWNGSLYLLSADNIYKFNPNASGFSAGTIWLKNKETLPSGTISLAINGSIWTITSTGQIASYSLGVRQDYDQADQNQFTSAANLATTVDTDLLAFTDQEKLVYVYSKSGASPRVFNFNDKKIADLAFNPAGDTLFVLCEDQIIYKIGL